MRLTYLPDDILVKVDRAAMAVSLETRVPFLDPEIARALRGPFPRSMKIRDGPRKWNLRQGPRDKYVPRPALRAAKNGLSGVPIDAWLRGTRCVSWVERASCPWRASAKGASSTRTRSGGSGRSTSAGAGTGSNQVWGVLSVSGVATKRNGGRCRTPQTRAGYKRLEAGPTMKKQRILFLCPRPHGGLPSQRFRFEQYLTLLEERGFEVCDRRDFSTQRLRAFSASRATPVRR